MATIAGLLFHYFLLNSSRFKLKLFPKLKHFFGKLKVSEILKLEFQILYWIELIPVKWRFTIFSKYIKLKDFWLNSRIFSLNSRIFSLNSRFRKFQFQWLPENRWKNKPGLEYFMFRCIRMWVRRLSSAVEEKLVRHCRITYSFCLVFQWLISFIFQESDGANQPFLATFRT